MTAVEPQQQLEFLSNVQRLLSEGQFTATYKYALLLAIADICVEEGEDDGGPFVIAGADMRECHASAHAMRPLRALRPRKAR